jgi:hypothetical protein
MPGTRPGMTSIHRADAASGSLWKSCNQFADFRRPPNGNRWNPAIDAVEAGDAA